MLVSGYARVAVTDAVIRLSIGSAEKGLVGVVCQPPRRPINSLGMIIIGGNKRRIRMPNRCG